MQIRLILVSVLLSSAVSGRYEKRSSDPCIDAERNCFKNTEKKCMERVGDFGNRSTTIGGLTCKAWNNDDVWKSHYPDFRPAHNYCRNPVSTEYPRYTPWCYTTSRNELWDYCFENCGNEPTPPKVPQSDPCIDAERNCFKNTEKKCIEKVGDFGNRSTTIGGLRCQAWNNDEVWKSHYPDFRPAHNYCRNPVSSEYPRYTPWCYTTSRNELWDYCFQNCGNEPTPPKVPQSVPSVQVNKLRDQLKTFPNSVPPGGVCSTDQHCSGYPFAICSGTCMCREGATNAGSTCVKKGTVIQGNCPAGQTYVSEAGTCMNIVQPGSSCQYSQQCSGTEMGAFCVAQRCRCVYGMVVNQENKCTFINTNCTQRGTVWISELGQCKPVVAPGEKVCSHRQQCTASYKDSRCYLQRCTCPPARPVAVDGTCGTKCLAGQTFSGVLGRCVQTAKPGEGCQYSSQCHAMFPGMVCDRGLCRCPNHQAWTGSTCTTACPAGYQVNPENGLCKPACRANQIEFQGDCLEPALPGETCRIGAQCRGGSACVSYICTCPRGTNEYQGTCKQACTANQIEFRGDCLDPALPGETCQIGAQCHGGSSCVSNICTCPRRTNEYQGMCKQACTANQIKFQGGCLDPALPGETCLIKAQCLGGSSCVSDTCTCPRGTNEYQGMCTQACTANQIEFLGDCLDPALPGETCRIKAQCLGGSSCVSDTCSCPLGTKEYQGMCTQACTANQIQFHGDCLDPALPGETCLIKAQCLGGSSCVSDTCTCPLGTNEYQGRCKQACTANQIEFQGDCLDPALPGETCQIGAQCLGGSSCVSNICTCPRGTNEYQGTCRQSKSCTANQIDFQGDCLDPALPGETCLIKAQCLGGSSCVSDTCTCPRGTNEYQGTCKQSKCESCEDSCMDKNANRKRKKLRKKEEKKIKKCLKKLLKKNLDCDFYEKIKKCTKSHYSNYCDFETESAEKEEP